MPKAARAPVDQHVCPMVDGVKPHVGGPLTPPCSLNVTSEGAAQARGTDRATCAGPPDFIVTGSGTVLVNGLPAARMTDKTMHGGSITTGAATVEIGGPSVGVTLGGTANATAACTLAATGATGRTSGSTQQSYNNCGVESARQIINTANPPGMSEDQLLNWAMGTRRSGWPFSPRLADRASTRPASGGTYPWGQQAILQRNGVPAQQQAPTMSNLQQSVAEGRGTIVNLDASFLWGGRAGAWHAVNATGVQYDGNGNLVNVIINDTGNTPPNNCGVPYSAATMQQAMAAHGGNMVVTDNRVW